MDKTFKFWTIDKENKSIKSIDDVINKIKNKSPILMLIKSKLVFKFGGYTTNT